MKNKIFGSIIVLTLFIFNGLILIDSETKNSSFTVSLITEAQANESENPCSESGQFHMGQFSIQQGDYCKDSDGELCGREEECILDTNGAYCQELKCK